MFKIPLKRSRRYILHIDADAFFASVEQVLNPSLKGKPMVVGGPTKTQGIVSAASYEARKFGISSGMPLYLANKKCPGLIVVNGHFDVYRDFSRRMYEIFSSYTPDTEMVSIDEAYLDITGCKRLYKLKPAILAKRILMHVYKDLGISVSCGLASNKLVSKVASSINKPHKLTVVPFGKESRFLAPLSLDAIPGIGPKTFEFLKSYGFEKVSDISALDFSKLFEKLGINGINIWKRCMGIDNSPVISCMSLPKSISKEKTFYAPVSSAVICLQTLKNLSEIVFVKLRKYRLKARTVFVKIKYHQPNFFGHNNFRNYVFQKNLEIFRSSDSYLFPEIKKLFLKNFRREFDVRLIGMGVCNLSKSYNLNLFESGSSDDELFLAIDSVKNVYGKKSLRYGCDDGRF